MTEKDMPVSLTGAVGEGENPMSVIRNRYDAVALDYDRMRRLKGKKPYNEYIEQPAMMAALEEFLTTSSKPKIILDLG